jgi:transposase
MASNGRRPVGEPPTPTGSRQVSQDSGLTETAVREWVKQADLDTGTRTDGLTSSERDVLAQLRRENRRLREDVDILKRATAFFAKETR